MKFSRPCDVTFFLLYTIMNIRVSRRATLLLLTVPHLRELAAQFSILAMAVFSDGKGRTRYYVLEAI